MEHKHICKYCGNRTSRLDMCSNCFSKKPLVKQLLDMVNAKAEEVAKTKEQKGE